MGDAAGIGPEIILKALQNKKIYNCCKPIVVGDSTVLKQAAKFCHITAKIHRVNDPCEGKYQLGIIDLLDLANINCTKLHLGKIQAMCGKAAYEYIAKAASLALANQVQAIVTAPINKESLQAAKINYIGHTEILAALCNIPNPLTMFETKGIRTFFLSRHVSLRKACDLVTKERVFSTIISCIDALKHLGVTKGIFAVAGLNPHCSENGLFGNEEQTAIIPAIKKAQKLGYAVTGPISADAIFHLAKERNYAALLSLYHDQGHIGMKTLDFEKTVAITCGLPFIRTSVDHGTAFDKAGKNIASPISIIEAIIKSLDYVGFEEAYENNCRNA